MRPSKTTSRPLHAALCVLLALNLVALMTPIPGIGATAAFAKQGESDAPPQDTPSPDNPNNDPADDPAVEPADDPSAAPADDPAADPADNVDGPAANNPDTSLSLAADNDGPEVRGPGEYLVTKLADEAIDFVDGAIVSVLDYAAEKTGYNIFTKAGDLLTLPSGKGDRELEKLCNEILGELATVDEDIKNLGVRLESDIQHLESLISTQQWAADRRELTKIAQKYTDAYNDYQNYLQAAANYSEAKESGDPNADTYKTQMEGFLQNFTDKFDPTKVGDPISFASDIRELATVCCKEYPSYKPTTTDAGSLPQLFLLQEANSVCDQTQAFEHQKFATLSAQANECMAAFARLSYVNRLWVDYQTSINPDKKTPANLLTEQKTVANEVVQAVNDISGQMQQYAGSLMRPYDFEVAVDMCGSGAGGTTHMYGHYLATSRPKDLGLYPVWSRYTMNAYQGKAIGSTAPFLLIKKTDEGALVHDDIIRYERDTLGSPRGTNYWDYSSMNQDWYNLFVSRDANYRLIDGAADLARLVNPQSYALSGGHDLFTYLAQYGGVDASLVPTATALTSRWLSAATTHDVSQHIGHPGLVGSWCFTYDYVADLSNYRLDQTDKQLKNRVKTANTSPFHYDEKLRNQEMLVVLNGSAQQRHTVGIEQTPGTSIMLGNASGNAISSGSWVDAGTELTVNIASTADDFGELQLVDRFGNVLDTLLTPEAFDLCADDHGIVTLSTTMPYQDCMVRAVEPNVEPPAPADVTACALSGFDDGQLFEPGASVPFAAAGAGMDTLDVPWGTQRLRPAAWSVELLDDSGATAVADGTWSAHPFEGVLRAGDLASGMYRLTATFARERFENEAWVDVGAPYAVSRMFTVHEQHVITGPEEPGKPVEPAAPGSDGKLAPTGDSAGGTAALTTLLVTAIVAAALALRQIRRAQ